MANYPKPTKGSRHNPNTGYQSGVRRQLREDRQVQAQVRQELYNNLSVQEKLARLGSLPATKERHKLYELRKAAETAATTEAPKKARKEKRA